MAMTQGDIIFLSASVPYRKGWVEDSKPAEIEEAILCIARAVFARGGRLLFGGHPSISPLVAAVAGEYYPPDAHRAVRPVITFQSEFFRSPNFAGRIPDETWMLHRMGWSSIEWTPVVPAGGVGDQGASLRRMREWMLLAPDTPTTVIESTGLQPPKAMISVGGMEGVRDEAAMFVRHRRQWGLQTVPPVRLFASCGGAAARLVEPVRAWRDRLWLGAAPDSEDLAILSQPSVTLRNVEREWWSSHANEIPSDLPFQPYAGMAQWLADSV
jgi:hypothetical protein